MSAFELQKFNPKWYSIFFNPSVIIRKGLYSAIKKNSNFIKGKVLDFGCGNKPYKNLFKFEEYIGLDLVTDVSDKFYHKADVFYDGKTIPFEDNTFDSIFSTEVLEHVFNPNEILKEWNRVLKKDGFALMTCPFFWPEHEQPYDCARYTSFGIKNLIETNGFKLIHYEKSGSTVAVLFQLIVMVLFFFSPKKYTILRIPFFIPFIAPFYILFFILDFILPDKLKGKELYLNNIVVIQKI